VSGKKNKSKASVANTYYEHSDSNNPARKLRDKVAEMEEAIKQKYKLEVVTKKIVIDESSEREE